MDTLNIDQVLNTSRIFSINSIDIFSNIFSALTGSSIFQHPVLLIMFKFQDL